jgi:signal transduction histidine kinase
MLITLYRTHPLKAELDAVAQLCNELSLMLATTPHLLALSDLQGRVVYASRPLAQLCTQGDILPEILWPMLSEASQKKLEQQWPQLSGALTPAAELTLHPELLWQGKWQHFNLLWQPSGQLAVWSLSNISELTDAQDSIGKLQQGLGSAQKRIAQLETRLIGAASLVETGKLSVSALGSMQEPVGHLKIDLSRFKFIQHDLRAMLDKYGELSTAPVFEAKLKECIAMAAMLNLKSLYDESEELLGQMEANTAHIQTLSRDLLYFAGVADPGQETALINDVADQLLWLMSARLRYIRVKRSYPDEVLKIADPARVAQILFHLISNAIEACPSEGGHIGISISSEAGFKACVRISDNGQGMDDTTRKHLFEPLYTTKPPEQHLGTGLFIARQLAESFGAAITVEHSELANGSTFALHLPLYGSSSSLTSAK